MRTADPNRSLLTLFRTGVRGGRSRSKLECSVRVVFVVVLVEVVVVSFLLENNTFADAETSLAGIFLFLGVFAGVANPPAFLTVGRDSVRSSSDEECSFSSSLNAKRAFFWFLGDLLGDGSGASGDDGGGERVDVV